MEAFSRMNGSVASDPHRETFELSSRYLELAAMVLDIKAPKKARASSGKNRKSPQEKLLA